MLISFYSIYFKAVCFYCNVKVSVPSQVFNSRFHTLHSLLPNVIITSNSLMEYFPQQWILTVDCFSCSFLLSLIVCVTQVYEHHDGSKSLKLGDFGLATVVNGPLYTVCGTPTYVAPEIVAETGWVRSEKPSPQSKTHGYSCGLLLLADVLSLSDVPLQLQVWP